MRALRRALFAVAVVGFSAAVGSTFVPREANASVSIAVGFDDLVKDADAVAIVTPLEHTSVWEDGRIYTYTHVKAEQGIAGELGAGAEGWIRTRGGVVGKIGQLVDGEPVFTAGKSSLLFLHKFKAGGTWEVSARAQGQYPVILDESLPKDAATRRTLRTSANVGMILPPRATTATDPSKANATPQATPATVTVRLAREVLHERPLDAAAREIADAWKRLHSRSAP